MTGIEQDAKAQRIAKVMARAGVCSRREAERIIAEGRVSVNGVRVETPATLVKKSDVIAVDGTRIAEAAPSRLFRYHKPRGLVTSARDEKGRDTLFDHLPPERPRLISVGRLDINSEGLLLLTNDGALKRQLELPSSGMLRRYRVRVHGDATEQTLKPLQQGIVVDRIAYQPMLVTIDRIQGTNAWLSVGLREGKNREIRKAMEAVGLTVSRLIRIAYGPFKLGTLPLNGIEEVRAKTLQETLKETLGADGETPAQRQRKERGKTAILKRSVPTKRR
jgi:23S rRNA pseudouridine2605 synthase